MSTVYVSIIGVLLAGFGMVFTLLGYLFGMGFSEEWRIYRSWIVMIVIALVVLYFGRNAIIPAIAIVTVLGCREFTRAAEIKSRAINALVVLAIVGMALIARFNIDTINNQTVLLLALLLIALVPIAQNRANGQLRTVGLAIFGLLYVGYLPTFLYQLAGHPELLLYLLLAVQVNDVAACNFGKLFGRHPLRLNISPKKTMEGSLAALAVITVLTGILLTQVPIFQRIVFGIIVSAGGQLGDLVMSYIKRDVGIKDMGDLIPGHGGMLDRVDSLIFVAPLFVLLLQALQHI